MPIDEDLLDCTLEDLHDIIRGYKKTNEELKLRIKELEDKK